MENWRMNAFKYSKEYEENWDRIFNKEMKIKKNKTKHKGRKRVKVEDDPTVHLTGERKWR